MNEDAFLSALHESPNDEVTWLALADWLDDDGQPQRAELVRLVHRLRTLPVMTRTKRRAALEDRVAALLAGGVRPVVPEITNSLGMRFALIEPGTFRMGAPTTEAGRRDDRDDEMAHQVELTKAFYLGVFPVTQRQYAELIGHNPSAFSKTGGAAGTVQGLDTDDFPVEMVSWLDAQAFVQQLNERPAERGRTYRLPSQAEWEYACRGGAATSGPFHLGDSLGSALANFNGNHPYGKAGKSTFPNRPTRVGSYRPNAFGLYDVHGNVWELCQDWHEVYPTKGVTADPVGPPNGSSRVIRGGSWGTYGRFCRSATRGRIGPTQQYNFVGFRVALDVAS